jgi:ferredoxin like protein
MNNREEKLLTVRHVIHQVPHIVAQVDVCRKCDLHPCVTVCPAGCFTLEGEEMVVQYEGCLECGTCRIICSEGALTWDYPLGGFGVSVRHG